MFSASCVCIICEEFLGVDEPSLQDVFVGELVNDLLRLIALIFKLFGSISWKFFYHCFLDLIEVAGALLWSSLLNRNELDKEIVSLLRNCVHLYFDFIFLFFLELECISITKICQTR